MEILSLLLSFCSLVGVARLLWVVAQKSLLKIEVNGKPVKLPLASFEEEARRTTVMRIAQRDSCGWRF